MFTFTKARSSGMCDRMTDVTNFLNDNNLRTPLFTGINIDQCVMGTLQMPTSRGLTRFC